MSPEELIEEAKRKYPPGTIFIPAHLDFNDREKKLSENQIKIEDNEVFKHNPADNSVSLEYNKGWVPNLYYRNKWAEIVKLGTPVIPRLEEAKKRFPIHSKVNNGNIIGSNSNFTIKGVDFRYGACNDILINGNSTNNGVTYTIYKDGKWADLIESLKEETNLEKAKRLYPPGTKFKAAHIGNSNNCICTVLPTDTFTDDGTHIILSYGNTQKNGHGSAEVVFYGSANKWAEIVSISDNSGSMNIVSKRYTLPKSWHLKITPDNLHIVNQYRVHNGYTTQHSYIMILNSGLGYTAHMPSGYEHEITTEQFIEFLKDKGLNFTQTKSVEKLPDEWSLQIQSDNLDAITAFRKFKNRHPFNIEDAPDTYKYITNGGWGGDIAKKHIITTSQFLNHLSSLGIIISQSSIRRSTKLEDGKVPCEQPPSQYPLCKDSMTGNLEPMPTMHTELKLQKREVPQVELIQVKTRTII